MTNPVPKPASTTRISWNIPDWCDEVGISRATFYVIEKSAEQAPRSTWIGRRRLIIESPSDYLTRMSLGKQKAELVGALERAAA